jgi:methylamine dehydrogenase heavy chain
MRRQVVGCLSVMLTVLAAGPGRAEIAPETIGVARLGDPQPTWFFAKDFAGPAHLFDAADGLMLGLLSLSEWTPAVQPHAQRGEIYAAESYYTRRVHGERTDVLTVYDAVHLAPAAEVALPAKVAALPFRHYVSLLDDGRHLTVFNMTPAQSVSIVDVEARRFVGEISTPGCALTMPSVERSFLMLCGDGTLQLIRLDQRGAEARRVRSAAFFDVEQDPVFDRPAAMPGGWLLVTYEGQVFEVAVAGADISVSSPWSLLTERDREEHWRVGGNQVLAYHAGLDLMLTLMHVGDHDTHEEPGTEVWVFDRAAKRRIARIPMEGPVVSVHVTPTTEPLLVAARLRGPIDVFDVVTGVRRQSIAEPGLTGFLLQGF